MALEIHETLKHPEVEVQLTGHDGNVFNIIGRCRRAIDKEFPGTAFGEEWARAAMGLSSYDEVLAFCAETLDVY